MNGLGKTSITLAALTILQRQGFCKGMLVIAPLRVCYSVWPKEVKKWDEFKRLTVRILHGPDKDRLLAPGADVYVVNPEGLEWLFRRLGAMAEWPFDALVVDESSKFKNTRTVRFKTLRPWLSHFSRRVILTGSPAPNGLLDLFGQVYVMDRGATFGPYITHYRTKYFYQTGFGGYEWALRQGADQEIYDALRGKVMRLDFDSSDIGLPPLVMNDVEVELPAAVRRMYDQVEGSLFSELFTGNVTAVNAAAASTKCRQIAGGGVYDDDGSAEHLHDAKVEATLDLLEELEGQPTLVAYEFDHERERLLAALPRGTPYLAGGVSARDGARIEAAWNRGEVPVLLVQPQSVSHGLNLQEAGRAVVWFSLTWNYEDYMQLIRRVWRQGQKETVVVHRIVAKDTVDEAMVESLAHKEKGQNALLEALKTYGSRRAAGAREGSRRKKT